MASQSIDIKILAQLEPISTLSEGRLKELAGLCFVERVSKDIDPLRLNITKASQAIYLLNGELGLQYVNGSKKIMRGGSEAARHPIDASHIALSNAIALTEIEIVRIDTDLLDIMMTWDQLAEDTTSNADKEKPIGSRSASAWMSDTGVFSAEKLQTGVFSKLPAANIDEMFKRMEPIAVKENQVVIRQGAEGDYYYLINQGSAEVSRKVEGVADMIIATLNSGDAFGEEALVSDNKRNATITMKTDGNLLRLNKADFIELLKAPLINRLDMVEALKWIDLGSVWLDVRMPSEYQFDHLQGATNVPLNQLREQLNQLPKDKTYIIYCQTGRRSSAAAFVLAGYGYRVYVLKGGLKG